MGVQPYHEGPEARPDGVASDSFTIARRMPWETLVTPSEKQVFPLPVARPPARGTGPNQAGRAGVDAGEADAPAIRGRGREINEDLRSPRRADRNLVVRL
jgi:hypothetical protein